MIVRTCFLKFKTENGVVFPTGHILRWSEKNKSLTQIFAGFVLFLFSHNYKNKPGASQIQRYKSLINILFTC